MKYAILERKTGDGIPAIELESGLRFIVNNISFPNENAPVLAFTYDLLCNPTSSKEEYEKEIGNWINYVLLCAIEDGTIDKML